MNIAEFFKEDDLGRNSYYFNSLPKNDVTCLLKVKNPMILSGLPFFCEVFEFLGAVPDIDIMNLEGKELRPTQIKFTLPFNVQITGERIALNLLQRSSSISTFTKKFVDKAKKYNIAILDTRKTTPGLRDLEKYAVRIGGGYNHRFGQTDAWMIKDNHKIQFGGIAQAYDFFKKQMKTFYQPIICEIHNLDELEIAKKLKISHVMLDNFSPKQIQDAIFLKPDFMTYEVSGGINLKTIDSYLIDGIDAISIGSITYGAPSVDLSLKILS